MARRSREPDNRRVRKVALTEDGRAMFDRLRAVAREHDARLRSQLSDAEAAQPAAPLEKLGAAVTE